MKRVILFIFVALIVSDVCRSQGNSIFTMISSHEDIPLKDVRVLAIPTQGAYFIAGNELFALSEESELKGIAFPDSMDIDDIIWNETDFIIKSGNKVYSFSDVSSPRLQFETDDFQIFPCDKGAIYVVRQLKDSSALYMANLKLKKARRLLNLHGMVLDVSKRGDALWVTTDECVYRFKDDKCQIVFWFEKAVHSVTMTDAGLLFATADEINILIDENQFASIFKGSNHGIIYDGEWLYIITDQYDLVRCASFYINAFLMFFDALSTEEE